MRLGALLAFGLSLSACNDGRDDAQPSANGVTSKEEPQRATQQANPGAVDCARASGQAQQLVCSDAQLSAIAREADRLYRLVNAQPDPDPSDRLIDNQRMWAGARDNCWKDDDLRQCVVNSYAGRIAGLRMQLARRDEDKGISSGPVSFRCGEALGTIEATFIQGAPGVVHLQLFGAVAPRTRPLAGITFFQVESASGAKYEGQVEGEAWSFWYKGREATLSRRGRDTACVAEVVSDQVP